ncbi:hypothetical protein LPU83_pLPU83d_0380 (plasmid) [Rhizobium favelukesii]|uniref:Uncharacterized protein n=1 Tax=Rhizobium favelukesii TaxID=348824 RepID=W6S669_9HYPH|nr:hypothetical protein LPU83_pLPU83d_0380 [Rhizobium favelukesii]
MCGRQMKLSVFYPPKWRLWLAGPISGPSRPISPISSHVQAHQYFIMECVADLEGLRFQGPTFKAR